MNISDISQQRCKHDFASAKGYTTFKKYEANLMEKIEITKSIVKS